MESRKQAEETAGRGGREEGRLREMRQHYKHHCLTTANQEEAGAHQPDDPAHRCLDQHLPRCPAAPPCPDPAEEHINTFLLVLKATKGTRHQFYTSTLMMSYK